MKNILLFYFKFDPWFTDLAPFRKLLLQNNYIARNALGPVELSSGSPKLRLRVNLAQLLNVGL